MVILGQEVQRRAEAIIYGDTRKSRHHFIQKNSIQSLLNVHQDLRNRGPRHFDRCNGVRSCSVKMLARENMLPKFSYPERYAWQLEGA